MFSGEVDSVTLPGVAGQFTVLKNHASLISVLKPGEVKYSNGGNENKIEITGGIADIDMNKIAVCVY